MGNGLLIKIKRCWSLSLLSIALVTLSATTLFAGEIEKVTWSTILPEENNIVSQQQRVINTLDITLAELDSVIDKNINDKKISYDSDFTINGEVSLVYDYLVYRIYELMKVDRKIKNEFATMEKSFDEGKISSDIIRQHYAFKKDYEKEGTNFFSSLDRFKRAVLVKDLKAELKTIRFSARDLRSVMALYSTYRVATAAQ